MNFERSLDLRLFPPFSDITTTVASDEGHSQGPSSLKSAGRAITHFSFLSSGRGSSQILDVRLPPLPLLQQEVVVYRSALCSPAERGFHSKECLSPPHNLFFFPSPPPNPPPPPLVDSSPEGVKYHRVDTFPPQPHPRRNFHRRSSFQNGAVPEIL